MFSLREPNIHNLAVEGVFDDCQDVVKKVNADAAFKAKYRIGAVNSINWARVAAQVVYYFKGYFAATKSDAEQVSFAVPSGNFGNIYAGYVAREMGLPVRKWISPATRTTCWTNSSAPALPAAQGRAATSSLVDGHFQGLEFRALRVRPAERDGAKVKRYFASGGAFDLSLIPRAGFVSGAVRMPIASPPSRAFTMNMASPSTRTPPTA
jgi:threonine synthase